jgi:hypothetical protein
MRAAIAESVKRLATGWKVRGSNPRVGGGDIFRTRLQTDPGGPTQGGPPSFLYNVYSVFPGDKAGGEWC